MEQHPLRARMARAAVCMLYTLTDGTGAPQQPPVTPNPTGVYIIHPRRVKGLETGRKIRRSRARYKHIALWQIWVRMQRAGANSPHTPLYKCIVYTDRPI